MDLSAIIFLALFVAWALYLIPKALSRHDDMARGRSVETFSSRMRVLGGRATDKRAPAASTRPARQTVAAPARAAAPTASRADAPVTAAATEDAPVKRDAAPATSRSTSRPASPASSTRTAARHAAQRRRRVLGALVLITAALGVTSYLAYTPRWSVIVPVAVILAFLFTARRTVRRERSQRAPVAARTEERAVAPAARVERDETPAHTSDREEQVADVVDPLPDEGSLWDPLPMTLPTYVHKAPARRTVRTIELTQMSSAGHDADDSALAAEARETEKVQDASADASAASRKAAGA